MKNRMFAFGCSGCFGTWATVADFIGINFDEYHNFGKGGACNTFSMNRLVEADDLYNFNASTDTVFIFITGFGRFSFLGHDNDWKTLGDLELYVQEDHPPGTPGKPYFKEAKNFVEGLWNYQWLIYRTYIAIKTMKNILESKKINHKIVMFLDNRSYSEKPELYNLTNKSKEYIEKIYSMIDVKESMGEFIESKGPRKNTVRFEDGTTDGHPTQTEYLEYALKHFPDLITDRSREFYNLSEKNFDWRSINSQPIIFDRFMQQFSNINRRWKL